MDRTVRTAGAAGIASVLPLLFTAVVILGPDFPRPGDPVDQQIAYFSTHRTAYLWAIAVELVSLAVLQWFLFGLRETLRARGERLADLVWVSGVAWTLLFLVEDALLASSVRSIDSGSAVFAAQRDAALLTAWTAARPIVVVFGVSAAIALRRAGFPFLLGAGAFVVAVANAVYTFSMFFSSGVLAPAGLEAEIIAVGSLQVWVLLMGAILLKRSGTMHAPAL